MSGLPNRWAVIALRLCVAAALLGGWELAAGGLGGHLQVVDPTLFSRPSLIAKHLYVGLVEGSFTEHLIFTLQAAMGGLVLGIVTGVLAGFAFAYNRWLNAILDPFMVALNSLPRPALGPALILIFGIGIASKVILSWSLVFFAVFYNTYTGIMSVDADLIRVSRVMGASRWQIFRHVICPSVFSWVFAALRLSVSYAMIGAVVGEFLGSTKGLGYEMEAARGLLLPDRVYAILFILMVVGVVLTEAARLVERRLLRWKPPMTAL